MAHVSIGAGAQRAQTVMRTAARGIAPTRLFKTLVRGGQRVYGFFTRIVDGAAQQIGEPALVIIEPEQQGHFHGGSARAVFGCAEKRAARAAGGAFAETVGKILAAQIHVPTDDIKRLERGGEDVVRAIVEGVVESL